MLIIKNIGNESRYKYMRSGVSRILFSHKVVHIFYNNLFLFNNKSIQKDTSPFRNPLIRYKILIYEIFIFCF